MGKELDNSKIKVIFFDAAETLFKTRGSVGHIYLEIAKKYGSTSTKGAIDAAFFDVFKKEPPPQFAENGVPNERLAIEKSWWYSVVKHVFTRV